mmetsp:Transcript_796/g.1206  ORF Transcript_796/g.1206 Transcript_796/m.1206 type:complete len:109 (-) Transcript_796:1019-1345(-)
MTTFNSALGLTVGDETGETVSVFGHTVGIINDGVFDGVTVVGEIVLAVKKGLFVRTVGFIDGLQVAGVLDGIDVSGEWVPSNGARVIGEIEGSEVVGVTVGSGVGIYS